MAFKKVCKLPGRYLSVLEAVNETETWAVTLELRRECSPELETGIKRSVVKDQFIECKKESKKREAVVKKGRQ